MKRAYLVDDVRSAEAPLLDAGVPLMDQAAYALAGAVVRHIRANGLRVPGAAVLALVGPGNNGGDALFAAMYLARRGMSVSAVCHGAVHAEGLAAARHAGVRIIAEPDTETLARAGAASVVWLDGLLGIGAHGALREPLASWVQLLSTLRKRSVVEPFVIAVDVPSGVDVDRGTVPGPVLRADLTVTMGAAKRALYLPPACHLAGEILCVPLGFEPYLPARPALASLADSDVRDLWVVPGPNDHKYTRGVLGVLAGSATYPGAGALCVGGARSTGVGMIRYRGTATGIVERYPDVVHAAGQVQAWAIGSGLSDLHKASEVLQEAVVHSLPVVLDATAIELVHHDDVPATVVITPHAGELAALLQARGESLSRDAVQHAPARAARLAATLTGATVVLKGAVNVIAGPQGPLYAQGGAPAWLATAGAGDVLAGVLGALLASYGAEIETWGEERGLVGQLAAAACHVHARAAQLAAHWVPMGELPMAIVGQSVGLCATDLGSSCGCDSDCDCDGDCGCCSDGCCGRNCGCGCGTAKYSCEHRMRSGSGHSAMRGDRRMGLVGQPITASDVVAKIPEAVFQILNPQP